MWFSSTNIKKTRLSKVDVKKPISHRRTHSDTNHFLRNLNFKNKCKDFKSTFQKLSSNIKSPRSAFKDLKFSSSNKSTLKSKTKLNNSEIKIDKKKIVCLERAQSKIKVQKKLIQEKDSTIEGLKRVIL